MLAASDLIQEVRVLMNRAQLGVSDDFDQEGFTEEDLEDALLAGVRFVAAREPAALLPDLVTSIDPTDPDQLAPADGGSAYPFVRLLTRGVTLGGVLCIRRSLAMHRAVLPAASDAKPAFIYEQAEFWMLGDAETRAHADAGTAAGALAQVLLVPMYYKESGVPGAYTLYGFDGDTYTESATKYLPVTEALRPAVVHYAAMAGLLIVGAYAAAQALLESLGGVLAPE